MRTGRWRWVVGALVATTALAGCSTSRTSSTTSTTTRHAPSGFAAPKTGYLVYWDQNEEVDYYESANRSLGQLMPAWDLNGQTCLLNDGTGRYVGGYDPTNPSQHNPGGPPYKQFKQPAIGEEMNGRNGLWTGLNLYVPGPYKMGPKDVGGDSPPDAHGIYNGQSTYTGCGVDKQHNVFADDIGTAQGNYPIPDDGRLVEWFAPSYKTYCILYGPTSGGVDGDHHVDGHGGLVQPGMMAVKPNGNLLVPQGGGGDGLPPGDVLEFVHSSLPTSAAQCPDGVYPRRDIKTKVFFQATANVLPVPLGIAYDPTCDCYAISSIFGSPASDPVVIAWFDKQGHRLASHHDITGESLQQFGHTSNGFNPFGLVFAPDGTLFFVDINIVCQGSGLSHCGTGSDGRVLEVTFGSDGAPNKPVVVAGGFLFPTSVTVCVPADQICPFPPSKTPSPRSGTQETVPG